MPRSQPIQTELPRLRADGRAHARGCGCPRCRGWSVDAQAIQRKAEAALARRRERRQAKALALHLELVAEEKRTDQYLREQAAIAARLRDDRRLDLLLASREKGKPVAEAIAEVERRHGGQAR